MIATTKRQPEYNKPAGAYVNSDRLAAACASGLRKEAEWRTTFDAVEKKFQVERWVILAIWGMETSYGAVKDKWDVHPLARDAGVTRNTAIPISATSCWSR